MSELEGLRADLHEKWMEKEHERAATDLYNFEGVFPAVGALIEECLRAALSYLGHEAGSQETAPQMAKKLRKIVASHPPAIPAEADVDVYLRLMDGLVLDAEAIDHFRSRFSGDWAEAYKGEILPNRVGWGATHAFRILFNAFGGEVLRKVEPRVPRDAFAKAYERVLEALHADSDSEEFMGRVVAACRELVPSDVWGNYPSLDYGEEVTKLRPLLSAAMETPPPEKINCFWFSIGYPVRGDETVADADVFGSSQYEPGSDVWEQEPPSYDSGLSLESAVLAEIYWVCQQEDDGDVRNFAEYGLLLAWTSFLGREITADYARRQGRRLGAIAGFMTAIGSTWDGSTPKANEAW